MLFCDSMWRTSWYPSVLCVMNSPSNELVSVTCIYVYDTSRWLSSGLHVSTMGAIAKLWDPFWLYVRYNSLFCSLTAAAISLSNTWYISSKCQFCSKPANWMHTFTIVVLYRRKYVRTESKGRQRRSLSQNKKTKKKAWVGIDFV